jgi:hypothetical protein
MRVGLAILALVTIGCGDRTGLLVDDQAAAPPSSTAPTVATAPAAPDAAPRPVDPRVAASLDGLRWELPCTSVRDSSVCATVSTRSASAVMGGDPGVTYAVALRFRGVVELSEYSPPSGDGYWQVGGAPPSGSVVNVYALAISSPPQTYYLNHGVSQRLVVCIDYDETVPIAAGATVTLLADSRDALELRNVDAHGQPIIALGVPPAPSPFDGQFIQMDVLGVTR